jgi:osmotically-inducible protein OsmY
MHEKMKIPQLILIIIVFTVTASAGVAAPRQVNDLAITLAVDTQLNNDSGVPAQMIDVQTQKGVVTLSGSVPHLLARDRADDIAATVKGVRAVINGLKVHTAARPDDLIRREVEAALLADPATDLFELRVMVRDGSATLSGQVDSWQEAQLCEKVAKGVKGVKKVDSNINVSPAPLRADDEIEDEIESKLAFDVWVRDQRIDVRVLSGHVILSGSVGSLAEKKRAFMDAWVAGVASVDDRDLTVDWLRHDDQMRRVAKPAVKTDDEIRQALEAVFALDPRVAGVDPTIMIDNGIVTLKGEVDNLAAKQAAGQDAANTTGVWQVKNHLKVRPTAVGPQTRPLPDADAELARDIRSVLARNPYVHQHEIGVTVSNRLVILRGTVDSEFEKEIAGTAVSGVQGVADVVNNLETKRDWLYRDDWEIRQNIEDELWWSPFLDEADIAVAVSNGAAALTGVVDTLRDRRIATENAYEGGAREVQNHLKVKYGPQELRP